MPTDAPLQPNQNRTLFVESEPADRRWKRLGAGLVPALACWGLAVELIEPKWETHVHVAAIGLIHWLVFWLGQRRTLVARSLDVYTAGGKPQSPILWSEIQQIAMCRRGVDLASRTQGHQHLPLDFLLPRDRVRAVGQMIRAHTLHQLLGPLRIPSVDEGSVHQGRLSVRPMTPDDRDLVVSLDTSLAIQQFQLSDTLPKEWAEASFDETASLLSQSTYWSRYVIEVDGNRAGELMLFVDDPVLRHASIGLTLLPEFQNQGHGSAALRLFLEVLRRRSSLVKVNAGCFADNNRCRRVLEKAGMRPIGTQSFFWIKGGHWKDGAHFEYRLIETP